MVDIYIPEEHTDNTHQYRVNWKGFDINPVFSYIPGPITIRSFSHQGCEVYTASTKSKTVIDYILQASNDFVKSREILETFFGSTKLSESPIYQGDSVKTITLATNNDCVLEIQIHTIENSFLWWLIKGHDVRISYYISLGKDKNPTHQFVDV